MPKVRVRPILLGAFTLTLCSSLTGVVPSVSAAMSPATTAAPTSTPRAEAPTTSSPVAGPAVQSPPSTPTPKNAAAVGVPAPPFQQCPAVGSSPSCAILIVVNPDGSATVVGDPAVGPFDGGDDTLVGVQNNTSGSITGLKLSSTLPIFALDGDGLCASYNPGPTGCPFGPTSYEGPNTSFVPTDSNVGNVLFTGGLSAGGSTYFSLESVVQAAQLIANVATTHFRVDLKAWIPQKAVVDPEQPVSLNYLVASILRKPCFTPSLFLQPFTTVSNEYLGNNHTGFDGDFKVLSAIDFDWDGHQVLNVAKTEAYGVTTLRATYKNIFNTNTCTLAQGQANHSTTQNAAGSAFEVSYSSSIPILQFFPAPPIDGDLKGQVAADGTIALQYITDLFPSHGLRVTKNGTPQLTDIVNNVSCLPDSAVKGFRGLATIGAGLSFEGNSGMESVIPTDTGKTHSNNSLLCGF